MARFRGRWRRRSRETTSSQQAERAAGRGWAQPGRLYELSPAGAQEFAAGTIAPHDTSAVHVGDRAIALVVGVPADADPRLNDLVTQHLTGDVADVDYHTRWVVMYAPAPSIDGVPAMARLDLWIVAPGPRLEARFLFDLDYHGPDLWAAALTGRVLLVTPEAVDEMGTAGQEVERGRRALTIPDAGGGQTLETALAQRMIDNPFSGSAL